ncbi:MAG: NfeD family protein [Actinomycetota bacterium]
MNSRIEQIVREADRLWREEGLSAKTRSEMSLELETHLREAADDGRDPAAVVGKDLSTFAREWAHEASGTGAGRAARRASRTLGPLVVIATTLTAAVLLSSEGGDVTNEVWRWIWTAIAVFFGIGEVFTAGFFLLPFAVGAAVAAVMSWLGASLIAEWIAFFGVSVGTLLYLQRYVRRQDERGSRPVGALRYVGQYAMVLEDVDASAGTGMVRVETEEWRATTDGPPVVKGATVVVTDVRGARLVVEEANT